ncbi:MAG: hypothetical protein IPO73_17250 [Gemmatimonadetes bacterium]|nr:hypothetical protein [Gemmatimonadota bacterium]
MISGRSRVFAILGDPVAHSLSPAMHNAAFHALGLEAVYVPLRAAAAEVPVLLHALARAGGGGNVTVPHKEARRGGGGAGDGAGPAPRGLQHLLGRGRGHSR